MRPREIILPEERKILVKEIFEHTLAYGVGEVWHEEIDKINIHQASLLAMRRAVEDLLQKAKSVKQKAFLFVDGRFKIPELSIEQKSVIDGDAKAELDEPTLSAIAGATGRPVKGYQAKIVDEHMNEVAPDTVGRLLDQYPTLTVELALRYDVAPGGQLDPAWRNLFLRHPDRFMVGTDTWVTSQWDRLPEIQAGIRAWLRQLPREVAEKLAFKNASRLTGKTP